MRKVLKSRSAGILWLLVAVLLFSPGLGFCDVRLSAFVERVVDGDTIIALVDTGAGPVVKERIRFAYIDAPELRGQEARRGQEAKAFLALLIEGEYVDLYVFTSKGGRWRRDRYRRPIARIFYKGRDMGQLLLDLNYAKPWVHKGGYK